eukprot:5479713-Lingulodinium_polyedra.AAC.1
MAGRQERLRDRSLRWASCELCWRWPFAASKRLRVVALGVAVVNVVEQRARGQRAPQVVVAEHGDVR